MSAALSLKGLRKTYGNGVQALRGIDLEVQPGDFFALLGPNGAGKTTAIGIICSLVNKTAGSVSVFGHDLDEDPRGVRASIGLVPQEFNFNVWEPVVEILLNQAGYYGIPRREASGRAETYLRQLGLWDKRREQARSLSGGMKRRLMIARALVHRPRLLILDEPTAGVDIELRRSMWDFLRETNQDGTTIILTTHYLEEAESLCRNIAIINEGVIAEHSAMENLLRKLHSQTFVLDIQPEMEREPRLDGFALRRVDARTLELDVAQGQTVDQAFRLLAGEGLHVAGLRNKTNRLEEVFLSLVKNGRTPSP